MADQPEAAIPQELQDIAEAVMAIDGKTPLAVLDAFLFVPPLVFGKPLLPMTAGHWMALEKLEHPWTAQEPRPLEFFDVAAAFHILTTPSAALFRSIACRRIGGDIGETVETISKFDMVEGLRQMEAHFASEIGAAVPMRSPSNAPHKPGGFGWLLSVITGACSSFHWPIQTALHEVPLRQLFALTACNAWGNGLEPAGETYEDRDLQAALDAIRSRREAKEKGAET